MISDTGAPAFPFTEMHTHGSPYTQWKGMTMRDYFAAKAMQSVMVDWLHTGDVKDHEISEVIARDCYIVADAMMKARSTGGCA